MGKNFHWRSLIITAITIRNNEYRALEDLTFGVTQNAATFTFISLKNICYSIFTKGWVGRSTVLGGLMKGGSPSMSAGDQAVPSSWGSRPILIVSLALCYSLALPNPAVIVYMKLAIGFEQGYCGNQHHIFKSYSYLKTQRRKTLYASVC